MQFILRCFRKMISCVCVMLEVQRRNRERQKETRGRIINFTCDKMLTLGEFGGYMRSFGLSL